MLLCSWDFPGKNTGVGCHILLRGTFPTQGSNPSVLCLLHCRPILYLSGKPQVEVGWAILSSNFHHLLETNLSTRIKMFLRWLSGKESTCSAGDSGSIPGLGRSPGGGYGNPLQYSCLENSMDRGIWQATVLGVTKSQTQLSD